MASASNMEPFSLKKTLKSLDPYPLTSPTPSPATIYSPDTAVPSCSYAPPTMPNTCHFKPLVQKPSSIEFLNEELKILLREKLVHRVLRGLPTDTLDFHRRMLIKELIHLIEPNDKTYEVQDFSYRNQLITLLASGSKQNIKEIPIDETEWIKLMNHWIRNNSSGEIIFSREMYRILAVDGFYGFKPKDLKQYLVAILVPLRAEFKMHVKGVRAMYDLFENEADIQSLTGTDSAGVIFLALLKFYSLQIEDIFLDDQLSFQWQQAQSWTEGVLHKHSEYYHDIKNVTEQVLEMLGQAYSDQFRDEKQVQIVGRELIKNVKTM